MRQSKILLVLIIGLLTSCSNWKSDQDKVASFNSNLDTKHSEVIDKFPQILGNWFKSHTYGQNYNGYKMKSILQELSQANNVGDYLENSMKCEQFGELDTQTLEELNRIALSEKGFRNSFKHSNFLGKAIKEYATASQDTILLKATNNEYDIRYVPSLLCEGYGNLEPEQLDDPIIKRLLFIELFLPLYMEKCK